VWRESCKVFEDLAIQLFSSENILPLQSWQEARLKAVSGYSVASGQFETQTPENDQKSEPSPGVASWY
jgi:hypothetical protein